MFETSNLKMNSDIQTQISMSFSEQEMFSLEQETVPIFRSADLPLVRIPSPFASSIESSEFKSAFRFLLVRLDFSSYKSSTFWYFPKFPCILIVMAVFYLT